MTVIVNSKPVPCDTGTTLAAVLGVHGLKDQKGIAVAVNNTVIPKAEWEKFALKNNDALVIIKATQGG